MPEDSPIKRLLIVRLSAMGDVIHALPAAGALRRAFPNAMIGWLIEERWAELLCAAGAPRRGKKSPQRPLVDWLHTVDLKFWRRSVATPGTVEQIAKVWNDVRSVRYHTAVDLQGALRSALLARWSGAETTYGAAEPRESPASLYYTRRVLTPGRHVIEQGLSLAESVIGHPVKPVCAELPRDPAVEERIDREVRQDGLRDFAIMNPGAGWGAKRWPAERYGSVARALAADGMRSIINYGPGEEDLAREAEVASAGAARAIPRSLTELIAITRRAQLFVGGDTGPMHLAAALKIPVVAIFGPTDPARNGPYGTQAIVLRNPASPTTHSRISRPDEAMLEISTDEVVAASRKLIAAEGRT